jgi:Fic family protein
MTIYMPPKLTAEDEAVIALIDEQRQRLRYHIANMPNRWSGLLRRNSMARAIQGSNSIEGYHATMDDVVAAIEDEEPMDATEETWREIVGYRNAMTYILQLAEDEHFEFHAQLLRSLHFMMMQHSLKKMPGRWRPGDIYVVNQATEQRVYEGPDAGTVPGLIDELVSYLNSGSDCHVLVKAAMAHLNFTMIHPFKDGNGRMARALQTLVLSREGTVSPVFSSIEEWLGRNTPAYYQILAEVGQGAWHPKNDPHPWVQFCLTAHFQQAHTLVKRNNWLSKVYEEVSAVARTLKLPERADVLLVDAAFGLRLRAGRYREENEISDVVASRDLRKMVDLELLMPHGEKRGRYYTGSARLREIAAKHKMPGQAENPYSLIRSRSDVAASPLIPGLVG